MGEGEMLNNIRLLKEAQALNKGKADEEAKKNQERNKLLSDMMVPSVILWGKERC